MPAADTNADSKDPQFEIEWTSMWYFQIVPAQLVNYIQNVWITLRLCSYIQDLLMNQYFSKIY